MCGIAGFIARPGRGRYARATQVLESIQHRGPDDRGWLRMSVGRIECGREWTQPEREPELLLLHRRLSVLDTSDSGWQPMSTADGRFHVTYNGEIYNYCELRIELERCGHRFHSRCDTEVLLAACAEWGKQALTRFVGMFAFALLDVQRRTVLLARDYFGIKPLYYTAEDGVIFFGSEIKALLSFGVRHREVNPERLLSYLRHGNTDFGAETLLTGIKQVPAAHCLELSLDGSALPEAECYWRPGNDAVLDISFDEAAQHVRKLFLNSVELHLRSDVRLGTALSGGIDSSSIVMAVRHLHPEADLHVFSYIAEEERISEERWVDIIAAASGAHLHKVRVGADELAADFEAMMHFHDEPAGGTSLYASYSVFRAARAAGITVMLDGQGADEILGGYTHYVGAKLASLLRQHRWADATHLLNACRQREQLGMYRALAFCADFMIPPAFQSVLRRFAGRELFPSWLNRDWFGQHQVGAQFMNYTGASDVLRCSLARSVRETLPALLRYEDRNSMAFSVESRVPFLVPDLVEFLGQLPEDYLISRDGTSKAVFREAMRGIVPQVTLERRDKIGYATPEKRWLKLLDNWVCKALSSEVAHSIPCLALGEAQREWSSVREGRARFDSRIWRWLDLIRWTGELGIVYNH
jgi:asparagine synthase (glutamine-hydrolysing)